MKSSRYIAMITTALAIDERLAAKDKEQSWIEVLNITRGFVLTGSNNEHQMTQLYIIPANKRTAHELTNQLKALHGVLNVTVVEISKPIRKAELAEVRKLYSDIGEDVSNIPNDSLALFIEDKLQEEYVYSMIPDMKKLSNGRAPLIILRTEDVPGVTPEMLKNTGIKMRDLPDRPFTKNDFETFKDTIIIQDVSFEEDTFEPPPPPKNAKHMSDDQLKRWLQKEHLGKPKRENIHIKRTKEEIQITIKFDKGTESFSILLNQR